MTPQRWSGQRERGSSRLVRLMIWLSLGLSRPAGHLLLYPIALYFSLFAPGARTASRQFLRRALERPVTLWDVLRHIFVFSNVLFDRLFFLSGRFDRFRIEVDGLDSVTDALARSHGCLLLGSHLGSFEAMRGFGRGSPVPVKVLMYRANGGPYTELVEALDPSLAVDIIEIGQPDSMLRVRESLARGEIVGILADRVPRGERITEVSFFGEPARFPTGPMNLATALGAPVVLFFGIRAGPKRYELHFEAFADRITLDRGRRDAQIIPWVQAYANRLEVWSRRYPFNWFNFYDFWEHSPETSRAPLASGVLPVAHAGSRTGAPVDATADR